MRFSTIFIGTGILVIISVVLMIGCVAAYDDVNDDLEKQIFNNLKSKGLNNGYVAIDEQFILIRFESVINENLNDLMFSIAKDAHNKTGLEYVRVEAYFMEEPVLALNAIGVDLENDNFDAFVFEDIRFPEFKIECDLGIFDVLVYEVNLDKTKAHIKLEYLADEDSFWNDYLAMSLLVVEDAPWTDEVVFEYLGENGRKTTITSKNDNILRLYNEEISADEFSDLLVIQQLGEVPTPTPSAGLVLHLPFDDSYNDTSGYGNNGAPKGNMRFTPGVVGQQAAYFDGKSYVEIPDSNSLDISRAFTFSVWLYKEDAGSGGWAVVLSKGDTAAMDDNSPYGLFHDLTSGLSPTVRLTKDNRYTHLTSTGAKTDFKQWHHLGVTWDGGDVKFYVDGLLKDTQTWEGPLPNSASSLLIGCDPPGATEYFRGMMDDLRIYDYALSASDVQSVYSGAGPAPTPPPTGVPLDDFNDNTINHTLWITHVPGSGPTVAETNQRVEITIPADSSGEYFGAGYGGICKLRGDFDIQVDYELLVWPSANGVRVGLSAGGGQGHVERVSFGGSSSDSPGKPREVYLTHFADGVHGITATSDLSGKLRLVRKGSMQTGYYFNSGSSNWIAIHSASITTADTPFSISAWSADYAFTDQEVKIAFDNLVVNQGEVICPGTTTPPPAWCDYFDSTTLDPRWSWVREDPTHWSLTDHPGYLRITTQRGDLWQPNKDGKNLLLTPAPSGDFEVTTRVTINPTANYHNAALFVYQDDDNYLDVARQYASMWGGQQVFLCKEVEGMSDAPHGVPCDLTTVYLKITKQNSTYTGYWSIDGSNWTKVYQYNDIEFSNLKVGFSACNGRSTAPEITADFDYICVAPVGAVPTPTPTPTPTPNGYSDFGTTEILKKGFKGNVYYLEEGTSKLPDFSKMTPVGTIYTEKLDIPPRDFKQGFPGITDRFEWFGISYIGGIVIPSDGNYTFKLTSDDGAKLYIDGELVIDNDGIHPPRSKTKEVHLTKGDHLIGVDYFQGPKVTIALQLFVETSDGKETPVKPVLDPSKVGPPTPTPTPTPSEPATPGQTVTGGEYECPQDYRQAYQWYIAAYNRLTSLIAKCEGDLDSPAALQAYEEYKAAKACYESGASGTETPATPTPTPSEPATPGQTVTGGEYECPQDYRQAYQWYIAAYNRLTSLIAKCEGDLDSPAALQAYEEYKAAKACYESGASGTEPSPTPTPTPSGSGTSYLEATLTHSGFDFSEGTTGESLINDGEIIFWQPGGGTHPSYPRDSGYLWWRNTHLDDVNRASQTKDMGAVDIATVREVPAEWDKPPLIPPLLMGHTIVAKCYDGYVKFQVISVDPADESARAKYLYSPDTTFDEGSPTLQPTP